MTNSSCLILYETHCIWDYDPGHNNFLYNVLVQVRMKIRKYGKNLVNVKKCNLGEEISQCPASIAEIKFWQ